MNLAGYLYGDLSEIADHLDHTEADLSADEIKAVLANLCRVAGARKREIGGFGGGGNVTVDTQGELDTNPARVAARKIECRRG